MKNKWIGKEKEICGYGYQRHEKGEPAMFRWRLNTLTGEIVALYHCKNCFEILHFPLSLNPKEKEKYDKWKNNKQNG